MKKLLFVINPYAGTKKANRYLTDIVSIFNRADYEVRVFVTQESLDAKRIVAQYAHEVDLVVCCGGDGTFNESLSGLLESGASIPIGYIPAGSTNDFASSLKLPTNILKAAQAIADGAPVTYDVGDFGGRYFSYVASFGAFTKASYATPQNIKNALGHTAYLLEGIQELSQLKPVHIRLELDDTTVIEDDFLFGAICNSTSVAGILTLDPKQVDMRDGRFEILLVRAPRDLLEISECVQAVRKQQYNCKMITFQSAKKIKIFADENMPWTLDGEKESGHAQVLVENKHLAYALMKGKS